jgi:hypothetical protein
MSKFTRNINAPFEAPEPDFRKGRFYSLARLVGVADKNYDAWWEGFRHIANEHGFGWDIITPKVLDGAYRAKDGMRK